MTRNAYIFNISNLNKRRTKNPLVTADTSCWMMTAESLPSWVEQLRLGSYWWLGKAVLPLGFWSWGLGKQLSVSAERQHQEMWVQSSKLPYRDASLQRGKWMSQERMQDKKQKDILVFSTSSSQSPHRCSYSHTFPISLLHEWKSNQNKIKKHCPFSLRCVSVTCNWEDTDWLSRLSDMSSP